MKLLFDENLSPRLPTLLDDVFPQSAHVDRVGLGSAPDSSVWEYAKANGYLIVSKDSDFHESSLLMAILPNWSGSGAAIAPRAKLKRYCVILARISRRWRTIPRSRSSSSFDPNGRSWSQRCRLG